MAPKPHIFGGAKSTLHAGASKVVLVQKAHPAAVYGVTEVADVNDPHQHTDHGNRL